MTNEQAEIIAAAIRDAGRSIFEAIDHVFGGCLADGSLAGSTRTIADAIQNLADEHGIVASALSGIEHNADQVVPLLRIAVEGE